MGWNPLDTLKDVGKAVYTATPLDNLVNISKEVYTGATTDKDINWGNVGRNIAGGALDTALILGTGGVGRGAMLGARAAGKGGFRQVASGLFGAGVPVLRSGFPSRAARVAAGFSPGTNRFLQIAGLGIVGSQGMRAIPELAQMLTGVNTPPTTTQFSTTPRITGTPDQLERQAGAQATTQTTTGGSTGGGTTGGSAGAAPENIGTTLPAVPPEVQAELDRQTIAAQNAYEDALNRIAQQRTSGSVGTQEAIRAARRAGTGGAVDIAAEAAEGGLGASPGIIGVAQDMLRQREATDVAAARKRFLELAAELGMTGAQAKRALDEAIANIGLAGLTARAQAGMNFIPQMGGI